jgi:hypothetical protein
MTSSSTSSPAPTSAFANTTIPHNYLTEELAVRYAPSLKLASFKSQNPHGGEYIDVSLDDGVNKDRKFKYSWKIQSKFGISEDKSDKKEEKGSDEKKKVKSYSVTAPLRQNPHLTPVVDALDSAVITQYAAGSAAYTDSGDALSKEVAKTLLISCARPPKKKESLAKYGANFKFKLYAETPIYIRKDGLDYPSSMAEVEKKQGTFIVNGNISKLHLNGKFNLVFLLDHVICELKPPTDNCFEGILNLAPNALPAPTSNTLNVVSSSTPSGTSPVVVTGTITEGQKRKFVQLGDDSDVV